MTIKSRIENLEKSTPEEEQKVFYSYNYKDQAEFDQAVEDHKANKPKNKPIVITVNGSYEDDLTGESIKRTMFKGKETVEKKYVHLSNDELDKGYWEVFGE